MELYDLSVIIVNYNARDYLKQCLKSLNKGLGKLKAEIWVVDNASTDGSREMLKKSFPQVILMENKENVGFAQANNAALKRCSAPLVLLLNNDTIVPEGAIDKMFEVIQQNKNIGALGPRILNKNGSVQISYGPMISLWGEAWQKFLHHGSRKGRGYINRYLEKRSKKKSYPYWISGSCMFLRWQALRQAGFFDESFFMYNEDVDLCHRMRQKGWEILYTPEVEIIHLGGKSASYIAERVEMEYRRSQLFFYRKYYSPWGFGILKIYLLCKFSFSYLISIFKTSEKKKKSQSLIKNLLKMIWVY